MSSRDHKPQEAPKTPTTATSESKREVSSNLDQDRVELLPWRIDNIKKLVKDRWEETLSEFLRSIKYSINDIPYDDKEKDKEKLVSYYARIGDGETVQWLIEHFQADVNLALYGAARGGQAKLVQGLVPKQGDRETFFGNGVEAHQRGEISVEVVEYLRKAWDINVRWGVIFASGVGNSRLLDHFISTYGQVLNGENLLSTAIDYCSNKMLIHVLVSQNAWLRRETIIHAAKNSFGSLAAKLINDSVLPCKADTAPVNVDALIIEVVDIILGSLKVQHRILSLKALKFVHELLCELDENFYVVFFNQFKQRIQHEFQSPQELKFPIDVAAIYENARNIRDIMRVTKMDFRQASIWARPEVQSFFSQSVFKDLQNNKVGKDLACLIAQNLTSLSQADCEFFWKHASFEQLRDISFGQLRDKLVKLLRFHAETIKGSGSPDIEVRKLADRYAAIGNRRDLIIALEKDLASSAIDSDSRKIINKYLQELNGAASTLASSQSSSGGVPEDDKSRPYSTQPVDDSSAAFSGFKHDSKGVEADERLRQQFLVADQDRTRGVAGDVDKQEQKQSSAPVGGGDHPLPGQANVSIPRDHTSFYASSSSSSSTTLNLSTTGALPDPTPPTPRDETVVVSDTAAAQQHGQSNS
jgi:hypothetical protein